MRDMMRWLFCAAVILTLVSQSALAHPDDEHEVFVLKGTLTKVDAVNHAIELDTIDPRTKTPRNFLVFVDRKAKLRHGAAKVTPADLQAGQRVTLTVENQHTTAGADRLVAFEIRIEPGRPS